MIHRCTQCKALLIPVTRIHTGTMWENIKIYAERAMHLKKENYSCWECPNCGFVVFSEIQRKFIFIGSTYIELKRALRKEKGEHCDT